MAFPGLGVYQGRCMIDERDIAEFKRINEKSGKRFTLVIWEPRCGNPFVRAICFEDPELKNIEFPLFGGQFSSAEEAFAAAHDLATSLL